MRSFCSASLIAIVAATNAVAQTDSDNIVVSATRRPTPADQVGSSVTVVLEEDIRARQYSFFADILKDVAGVSIARNSAFGGVASARIRGASSGQTLVVIDGVVMNDPAAPQGGFNFANLDVVDIERIEVLRGPQSLLYGADAIGGVIFIRTKRAAETGANIFLEGGARGSGRGGATLSAAGDVLSGRLTVSGVHSDGLSRAAIGDEADGFRSVAASGTATARLGAQTELDLIARVGDARAEIDGFPPPSFFILDDTLETEDTTEFGFVGRLRHEREHARHAVSLTYNDIDRVNRDAGVETFGAAGNRLSADYLGVFDVLANTTISVGGELERIAADVSGVDEAATNGSLFAVLNANFDDVTISVGGRRDEFSNFEGATTARVAGVYRATPNLLLRASWGQGFRAPSLFELNFDQFGFIPNPDLRPERANGFDAGLRFKSDTAKFGVLSVSVTGFHQKVRDQIAFDFSGSGYFNIAATRSRGVETEINWTPSQHVEFTGAYAFVDANDRSTGQQLLRQPRHAASFITTLQPFEHAAVSATVRFNGAEADFPSGNASWVTADLRGSYQLTDAVEIFARVENIADAEYQDVSGYREPGRSAFGGVRLRL